MKKIIGAIFAAVICMTAAVTGFCSGAVIIESVDFEKYTDSQGMEDETLVNVRVTFTAPYDVEQVSVYLTSEDISEISNETKSAIIYMDQAITPSDGMYVFPVEKSRIASCLGTDEIEGETLWVKMSGKGIEELTTVTVVYSTPIDEFVYGDVNNDGEIDFADAILILRYDAGIISLTETQLLSADVNGDDDSDFADAILILQYEAGLVDKIR